MDMNEILCKEEGLIKTFREAIGKIEKYNIKMLLYGNLGCYFVSMENLDVLLAYDSECFYCKYFANRRFNKLKKKYNLKEVKL